MDTFFSVWKMYSSSLENTQKSVNGNVRLISTGIRAKLNRTTMDFVNEKLQAGQGTKKNMESKWKDIVINYLDSFQYAATSNLGRTRVAFNSRAMPTPSHNCTHDKGQRLLDRKLQGLTR